jgi:hypothetical protein
MNKLLHMHILYYASNIFLALGKDTPCAVGSDNVVATFTDKGCPEINQVGLGPEISAQHCMDKRMGGESQLGNPVT